MPRVLNKNRDPIPKDAVYIGRPSKWGNPFKLSDHTRQAAIEKYENYLYESGLWLDAIDGLAGKDLVCFCSPYACHGDVLLRVANQSGL